MNSLNQWHEVIAALELENFKHEDATLLLREADLPNPGLFKRISMTLKDMFGDLQVHPQRGQTASHRGSHTTTRKLVT